jgi:LysM repeat protein
MSVATEYPPTVFIPVRARQVPPALTPTAPDARPRLSLVPTGTGRPPAPGHRVGQPRRTGRVRRPAACPAGPALASVPSGPVASGSVQVATRPVRLTRRGMVALALAVAAVGGLLLLVAHLSTPSAAPRPVIAPGAVVTVLPGDTLWSIAGQVAPGRDPRRVVEHLRDVNHLTSVSLTPGQTLKVG